MCNMKIIKPKKLQKGDTIGILAISGKIKEFEKIEKAKKFFEKEGYNVVISQTCKTSHRYMAGENDDDCLNTLHNFFEDKNIDAILCARGGYGTLRFIDKINWELIEKNPKIFAGFSDITTLLNMIFYKTGLITFHSAMAYGDFGDIPIEYTQKSFFNTLTGNTKSIKAFNYKSFHSGEAKGTLFGGNLSTLISLCGTDFIQNKDLILFLEDLNEPIYKIDKMITQLFNIKEIQNNVKGLAIGEFSNIDNEEYIDEILQELALKYKIPICDGFKITHEKEKETIPIGIDVTFNANNGTIEFNNTYLK